MQFTKDTDLLNEIESVEDAPNAPSAFLSAAWILAALLITIGIGGLVPLATPLKVLVFLLLAGAALHVFATIRRPTPR